MRALVTAGGTSEPVDDVRVLTNRSTGRFGAAIANALCAAGVETLLLGSRAMLARRDVELDPGLRCVPFESFLDLQAALAHEAQAFAPDLVFMAAAVSDYSPTPHVGKLSSSDEERSIALRRNPKLLTRLRGWCGEDAFLVGFKLLSSVPRDELIRVARAQIEGNGLDLCVANDLAELGGATHPVVLVSPGEAREVSGARAAVARAIVDYAQERCAKRGQGGAPASSGASDSASPKSPRDDSAGSEAAWERAQAAVLERARRLAPGEAEAIRVAPLAAGSEFVGAVAETSAWRTACALDGASLLGTPAWPRLLRGSLDRDFLGEASESDSLSEHGFLRSPEGGARFATPTRAAKVRRGASLCLYHPPSRQVLVGRRCLPPYQDRVAFPGGGIEAGESAREAAGRELREETGLPAPPGPALSTHRLFAGGTDRVFELSCLVVAVARRDPPQASEEFVAAWTPLEEALADERLTAGTRWVLEDLARRG